MTSKPTTMKSKKSGGAANESTTQGKDNNIQQVKSDADVDQGFDNFNRPPQKKQSSALKINVSRLQEQLKSEPSSQQMGQSETENQKQEPSNTESNSNQDIIIDDSPYQASNPLSPNRGQRTSSVGTGSFDPISPWTLKATMEENKQAPVSGEVSEKSMSRLIQEPKIIDILVNENDFVSSSDQANSTSQLDQQNHQATTTEAEQNTKSEASQVNLIEESPLRKRTVPSPSLAQHLKTIKNSITSSNRHQTLDSLSSVNRVSQNSATGAHRHQFGAKNGSTRNNNTIAQLGTNKFLSTLVSPRQGSNILPHQTKQQQQQPPHTPSQQFLESEGFLKISQKQVTVNQEALQLRNKQLQSASYRQKDMSCLSNKDKEGSIEKEQAPAQQQVMMQPQNQPLRQMILSNNKTSTLQIATDQINSSLKLALTTPQNNAIRGHSRSRQNANEFAQQHLLVTKNKRMSDLRPGRSTVEGVNAELKNSLDTEVTIPDVFIHNKRVLMQHHRHPGSQAISPTQMKQSRLSDANSSSMQSGLYREPMIIGHTLAPPTLQEVDSESQTKVMTRSKQNPVKINRFMETFGGGASSRDGNNHHVHSPDSAGDEGSNFFSARETMGRIRNTPSNQHMHTIPNNAAKLSNMPNRPKTSDRNTVATKSYDVLSPKNYNSGLGRNNFAKQHSQTKGGGGAQDSQVTINVKRRYTAQRSRRAQIFPLQNASVKTASKTGRSTASGQNSPRKTVVQSQYSQPTSSRDQRAVMSQSVNFHHKHGQHSKDTSETQAQASEQNAKNPGIFQNKPQIEVDLSVFKEKRGQSANNYNSHRQKVAQLSNSLQQTPSIGSGARIGGRHEQRNQTFSWDQLRAMDKNFIHESFSAQDPGYRRIDNITQDIKKSNIVNKSHVKVPQFLKDQLSSRTGLANVNSSVDVFQNLISSRFVPNQDAALSTGRKEIIHVLDLQNTDRTARDDQVVTEQFQTMNETMNQERVDTESFPPVPEMTSDPVLLREEEYKESKQNVRLTSENNLTTSNNDTRTDLDTVGDLEQPKSKIVYQFKPENNYSSNERNSKQSSGLRSRQSSSQGELMALQMPSFINKPRNMSPRKKMSELKGVTNVLTEVSSESGDRRDRSKEFDPLVEDMLNDSSDRGSVSMRIDSGISVAQAMQTQIENEQYEELTRQQKAKIAVKEKHELESRKAGKFLPISTERLPQNALQMAVHVLSENHNFEKLVGLSLKDINEETFVSKLHQVEIATMDKLLKDSENNPTTDDTTQRTDSKEMANQPNKQKKRGRVMTMTTESDREDKSKMETREDLELSDMLVDPPKPKEQFVQDHIPLKYREQIKNPAWKLEQRPAVIDVMFNDIIHSYEHKKDLDIFSYQTYDYLNDIRQLEPIESLALDVKISHDLLTKWRHYIKPPPPAKLKKRTKIKTYAQGKAHASVISVAEISLNNDKMSSSTLQSAFPGPAPKQSTLGKLLSSQEIKKNSEADVASSYVGTSTLEAMTVAQAELISVGLGSFCRTNVIQRPGFIPEKGIQDICNARETQESVSTTISSQLINEMQCKIRDIKEKRVTFHVHDAQYLQKVTTVLDIDFEAILKLQRKVKEYGERRIHNVLPLIIFDDFQSECEKIQIEIVRRRLEQAEPLAGIVTMRDDMGKRITDYGEVLDYDTQSQMFIVQIDDKRYFMHRLCVQLEELESKQKIEDRRVAAMQLSKNVLLRLNIERIFLEEVLKLRPEVRQPAFTTNNIERYLDIKRFQKFTGYEIRDEQIRNLVGQFESLYCFSIIKSIIMSEVEQDSPQYSCIVSSYSVEKAKMHLTPYYGLRAYENEGAPINHLIAKKDCQTYLNNFSLLGRVCFQQAFKYIQEQTLEILNPQPVFQVPIQESTAYSLIVRPKIKANFKDVREIMTRVQQYPLQNLEFAMVQQEIARSFSSVCINVWQDRIIKFIRKTILDNFKDSKKSLMTKDKASINPYILRFLRSIYQVQMNHLFAKYEQELTKYLEFLLSFANQSEDFRAQQQYLNFRLEKYNVQSQDVPLIESHVTIKIVSQVVDIKKQRDLERLAALKKNSNPFKNALRKIKPQHATQALLSAPSLEDIYTQLYKTMNTIMCQFTMIPTVHRAIYKFVKFSTRNIAVSPDLTERDIRDELTDEDISAAMESVQESSKGQTTYELQAKDQVYALRKQIEFIMTDVVDKVNKKIVELKPYVKYIGYKFDDMLFELKALIFQNQMDIKMQNEEEDLMAMIDFQAEQKKQDLALKEMVDRIEITDQTYLCQYKELETAYWKVQMEVQDEYNFGLIKLNCRKFKEQAIEGLKNLVEQFRQHLLDEFCTATSEQTANNKENWDKVLIVHIDIDKTIEQIEFVSQMQNEEVFDDMINFVKQLGQKKTFLDKLSVMIPDEDFDRFLKLHSFPQELKREINIKEKLLQKEQLKIQKTISNHQQNTRRNIKTFNKDFKTFRDVCLPTKKEFLAGLDNNNANYIYGTLERMMQDGLGQNDDETIWDTQMIQEQIQKIADLNAALAKVEEDTRTINRREEALQMKLSDFPELFNLKQEIKPLVQLWETIQQYNAMIEDWKDKPISRMTLEEIEEFCNEWYRKLLYVMRNSTLIKFPGPKQFAQFIMREIENIRLYLPLLTCLKVKGLDRRHIQAISKAIGETLFLNKVNFRFLQAKDFHKGKKYDAIKQITDAASKEYAIRLTIEAVEVELETTKLMAVKYKDSFILKNLTRDMSNFTECSLKVTSVAHNSSARVFKERIERLQKELNRVIQFFQIWNDLQKYWAYLLPIFNQRDISHHMPEQYEKFVLIDRLYRQEVEHAETRCKTYKTFAKRESLRVNVPVMMQQFEYLMKCLIKYLEQKREYFPRLFFLSNEQIIEIVGMVEDISQLEKNLFKMFEGIDRLIIVYDEDLTESKSSQTSFTKASMERKSTVKVWRAQDTRLFKQGLRTCLGTRPVRDLGQDLGKILGVANQDAELLEFTEYVKITDTIEQWLKRVEYSMKFNVSRTIQQSYHSFKKVDFMEWIKLWPTQFLLIVLEIDQTQQLQTVFSGHSAQRQQAQIEANRQNTSPVSLNSMGQKLRRKSPPKAFTNKYGEKESAPQAFKRIYNEIQTQITLLTHRIRDQLPASTRQTINSLIINRVHCRDTIRNMITNGIDKACDFLWNIQMKYDFHEKYPIESEAETRKKMLAEHASAKQEKQEKKKLDFQTKKKSSKYMLADLKSIGDKNKSMDEVQVKVKKEREALEQISDVFYPTMINLVMIDSSLPYGYEFLSNSSRLVISPLTERCFQSLFLALQYKYGGAPIGPAGTGKTESIKELGKNMARHCFVFNCQGQIDYAAMSKFFKGLAANGTWVCFDEFNRLEINVLSIISQLIIALSNAKHDESTKIQIEGTILPFNMDCGLFITMNPYHFGRTPLPDNLKALFRQITMVVPDTLFIAEILLYSVGFSFARNLAFKITRTFALIHEQLRFEQHYDFGLRTVKQVLIYAGELKLRCMKVKTKANIAADGAKSQLEDHIEGLQKLVAPTKKKKNGPSRRMTSSTVMKSSLLQQLRSEPNSRDEPADGPINEEQRKTPYDIGSKLSQKKREEEEKKAQFQAEQLKIDQSKKPRPTTPSECLSVDDFDSSADSNNKIKSATPNLGPSPQLEITEQVVKPPLLDIENNVIIEESSMLESSEISETASDSSAESGGGSSTEERMRRMIGADKKPAVDSNEQIQEQVKESDTSDEETTEKSSSDQSFDELGLDKNFIIKELGCNNKRVFQDEELLDQFIVLKAIIDKNLPKLLFKDISILTNIVTDVFPNIPMTQINSGKNKVIDVIDQRLNRRNLFRGNDFIQNIYNIIEALASRHGIMVVGRPQSGKTTCIRILQDVLTAMHQKEFAAKSLLFQKQKAIRMGLQTRMQKGELVPRDTDPNVQYQFQLKEEENQLILNTCIYKGISNYTLNPKCITMSQLMGFFDETSREWTDGILTSAIRSSSQDFTGKRMLVTCDGPIEPDWVENLNSVLDDNKRLSLITGETIYLTHQMNILLETSNLADCTPATISRCAICYIRGETLPAKAQFNSWLQKLPKILKDQQERLDLFANYFITEIFENFLQPDYLIYPVTKSWSIITFVRLFDSLIYQYRSEKYNDPRLLKKIALRMQVEKDDQDKQKELLARHKDKFDKSMEKKAKTEQNLAKMQKMNTMSHSQIKNMKSKLIENDSDSLCDMIEEIDEESDENDSSAGVSRAPSSKKSSQVNEQTGIPEPPTPLEPTSPMSPMSPVAGDLDDEDSPVEVQDGLLHLPDMKIKEEKRKLITKKLSSGIVRSQTTKQEEEEKFRKPKKETKVKFPEQLFVDSDTSFELSIKDKNKWMDSFFLYSIVWAFGSLLTHEARRHFNTWLHQTIKLKDEQRRELAQQAQQQQQQSQQNLNSIPSRNIMTTSRTGQSDSMSSISDDSEIAYGATQDFVMGQVDHMEVSLPPDINVFDLFFDTTTGKWQSWKSVYNHVIEEKTNERARKNLLSVTVPTQDYCRIEFILDRFLEIKKPIMLMGPTAQGKSTLLRNYVYEKDIPIKQRRYDLLGGSNLTTGQKLQTMFENRLVKGSKTLLQPPDDNHQVFFIDDIHMTHKDRWKDQSANELLRQFLDFGGWYNLEKIFFKKVRELNFCTTISTRQQNKEIINERLGWHFGAIGVINFQGCNLEQIYRYILTKQFMNTSAATIGNRAPDMILEASMKFFQKYKDMVKPSPTMFLFKINERNMLYMLKGIIDAPNNYYQMIEHVAFIWVNEVCRALLDRYTDPVEHEKMFTIAKTIASETFLVRSKIFPRDFHANQFFYGQPESENQYNEIMEEKKLVVMLNDVIEEYNKHNPQNQLNVVIFSSIIERTLKINRSIQTPMANTILIADQGSGANELCKVAIKLAKSTDNTLFASDSEQMEDWKSHFRAIVSRVALETKQRFVLHLIERDFVSDVLSTIDSLAAHGELFQLFNTEELDSLMNQVRYKTFGSGVRGKERTESQLLEEIREQVHLNLHMLLQLTPRSQVLLSGLRETPHLLNSSTLIYFGEWDDVGFMFIAKRHLTENPEDEVPMEISNVQKMCKVMIEMYHDTVKAQQSYFQETDHYVYISPQQFEMFVQTFKRMFRRRSDKLLKHRERFRVGLEGIRRTQAFTEKTQDELSKKSPELVEKQRAMEALIDELEVKKRQISKQIQLILQIEDQTVYAVNEAKIIQKECDKRMQEAAPVFNHAVEGLLQITKKEINELRSIKKPLDSIRTLLTAVCLILGEEPMLISSKETNYQQTKCYWTTAISSRVLADRHIIQRMTQVDPTQIQPETIRMLEGLIETGDIAPLKIQKATFATRGMYSWVMAVRNYFYVYKTSEPLRNKLILADIQLQEMKDRKAENQRRLAALEKLLYEQKTLHNLKEDEVKMFQKEIEEVFMLKSKSARLLNELAGEKQKWMVCEEVALTNIKNLEGDSLISSAMVAFLAPFTQKTRDYLYTKWLLKIADNDINITRKLNFNSMFSDPLKIKGWLDNGLPNDSYSIQNAIILKNTQMQPILIDPQTQANKWLRNELKEVKILNMQTSRFLQELKLCIKLGSTVVIENVDEMISSKLFPLFLFEKQKQTTFKRTGMQIVMDAAVVQIDPSFKMYITSVHKNPDFGSDISLITNFINFSVTIEAFEAQILALLLSELETEQDAKQRIYRRQALVWIKRLKTIEDDILEELKKNQPQEMLIKREHLIEKLMESRTVSKQTGKTLTEINNSMKILMQTSKLYKPVSQRAAKFFFVANDLVKLNNMYQFTHEWFISFFSKLVTETIIDDSTKKRKEEAIRRLQANFVRIFYAQVCQTLFEGDKLLFSFLLAYKELEVEFKIDKRQVEFFIKGALQQEDEIFHPRNLQDNTKDEAEYREQIKKDQAVAKRRLANIPWISLEQWKAIDKLSALPPFNQPNLTNKEPNLSVHIETHTKEWYTYINGNQLLDYTMARFTTKDEDGNSMHSSYDEEDSENQKDKEKEEGDGDDDDDQKSGEEEKKHGDSRISDSDLRSVDSFSSASISSKDFDTSSDREKEKAKTESDEISLRDMPAGNREFTQQIIRRVNTKRFLDLGVPGGYEKFNYEDAIRQGMLALQLEQEVKNRIAEGLKRIMCQGQSIQKTRREKELDDIFALDGEDSKYTSQDDAESKGATSRGMSESRDADSEVENVDDAFEDFRKNNVEEDTRIALAIIQGIAEYAEFKVHKQKKLTKRQQMKQYVINSHIIRLCIMRCFHPEKLYHEIKSFISYFLGRSFTEPPPFEFVTLYRQTSKLIPILFMVGPNVNPYTELSNFKMIQPGTSETHLDYQPLGQIPNEKISKKIIRGACEGHWLLLDNLQLSLELVANLQKFLENMYSFSKSMKTLLMKKAKLELKDILNKKKEAHDASASQKGDSQIAMELMLLQQSIMQDSAETTFNPCRVEESWEQNTTQDDKSFSISIQLQDKLKAIVRRRKTEARSETIRELDEYERQQKAADESSEMRELTTEEKLLKELVFPELLGFPIHKKFRLWISVIPVPQFPANFARRCLKISLELPINIRPNTVKSFSSIPPSEIGLVTKNTKEFKRMLFSMTVMHAVINQRERFNSFGWTQPYYFSPNDLQISIKMLAEVCQNLNSSQSFPLKLMRYLVGTLNYGGKLTQKEDQTILDAQVKTFINTRVFDDAASANQSKYSRAYQMLDENVTSKVYDLTGTQSDPLAPKNQLGERTFFIDEGTRIRSYMMPVNVVDLRGMKEHVRDNFPLEDMPQIFGLHHNATIKAMTDIASTIMQRTYQYQFVIKRPKQPALTQVQSNRRNTQIYEYFRAKLKEIRYQIPEQIPPESYEDAIPIMREKPFNTLLSKEIQHYNFLIGKITDNLDNTLAAMEGLRQHARDTENTFESLQQDQTPAEWTLFSYPCHRSIGKFVDNLQDRIKYIEQLLDLACNDKLTSRKFWMPGFFSQRNFLTTLMQEVARKQRLSIEMLTINWRIMGSNERMFSQIKAEGTNSYYIEGLYLYGADWDEDEQNLVDSPKHQSIGNALPLMHVMIEQQDLSQPDCTDSSAGDNMIPECLTGEEYQIKMYKQTHYLCPMYVNFSRNRRVANATVEGQLITTVPIPIKSRKPKFWIKRNCTILCYNESTKD